MHVHCLLLDALHPPISSIQSFASHNRKSSNRVCISLLTSLVRYRDCYHQTFMANIDGDIRRVQLVRSILSSPGTLCMCYCFLLVRHRSRYHPFTLLQSRPISPPHPPRHTLTSCLAQPTQPPRSSFSAK